MRFIIGLLSGAGVILLLAQLGGAPDARWLDQLPNWFDRLAGAAGEALALPPRPPAPTSPPDAPGSRARPDDQDVVVAAELPARQPIPRPPDTRPMTRAAPDESLEVPVPGQAAPGQAAPGQAAPGPAEVTVAATEDVERIVAARFGSEPAAPAREPGSPESGTADAGFEPALSAPADAGRQAVWAPFHSRMSASGFAEQLSVSLDHPFLVERRGPGRYQVVFGYRNEPQRQALLAQAAELTGLQL